MRGLPDWGQPRDAGFGPWQEDGFALALPDALVIATGPGGAPEFHLSAWRPAVPSDQWRGYGRLDMVLAVQATTVTPDGSVRAVAAVRGWLRLGAEALALPEEFAAPVRLACAGTGAATLVLPLHPEGVGFVERALMDGALPVLATADLEIAGVARCVPGRAVVQVERLRSAVEAGLTPDALRSALLRDAAALGVTLDSDDPAAAEAAADHIRAHLCAGPLLPGAEGLLLVWADSGMTEGRADLDLAQPVVATRAVRVMLDPFAMVRGLAAGGVSALVTKTTTGTLQAGQHQISMDANLPRPLAGPLAMGARLVFAPQPPARMHEVSEEVELPADGGSVLRSVRLAVGEAVDWLVTGVAYMPTADGRGVVLRSGPPRAGQGVRVVLGRQDFPLHFTQVAAGAALLALADVEVELASGGHVTKARLTPLNPVHALALAEPGGQLIARLVAHDGQVLTLAPRPAADWRIELTDVPGYGLRVMEIEVGFPERMLLRALDVKPEGEAVQTLAFTPARSVREVRWFCRDPFRPGLCWRWHDGEAAFSAPVSGDRLRLDATEGAVA
jgi:hypothetical protein